MTELLKGFSMSTDDPVSPPAAPVVIYRCGGVDPDGHWWSYEGTDAAVCPPGSEVVLAATGTDLLPVAAVGLGVAVLGAAAVTWARHRLT